MKKVAEMIAIEIPMKPYCKAYVLHKLGDKPIFDAPSHDSIISKLYDVLEHSTNEKRLQFDCVYYTEKIKIYIPFKLYRKKGCNLNESNIKSFNRYIEMEVKHHFYNIMDDLIEYLPSFENNLPEVRRKLGIDKNVWSLDSMKKCYYRKRIKQGENLLYEKRV